MIEGMYRRVITRYGADPLHLLVLLACFTLAGYAASRVIVAGIWLGFLVWFVSAAIIHDLILYPLYAVADVVARWRPWHRLRPPPRAVQWPPVHDHVRVPVAFSGLLLLVWFPLIFRLSEDTYRASTGLDLSPYLGRWLLVTGVLFAGSALAYALRVRRRASRRERATPPRR